jgi:hypothetical protein
MAERASVQAYVVETNEWGKRVFGSASDLTYKKIVGLQYPEKKLWIPDGESQATEAEELKIDMTPELRDRLLGFFAHYLADSNCHRFANFMSTGEITPDTPHGEIVEAGEKVETLDMGQHGVMGYFTGKQAELHADHSISGLGHETDQALQVTRYQGDLGMARIADLVRVWKPISVSADNPMPYEYGIYALPETAPDDSFTD